MVDIDKITGHASTEAVYILGAFYGSAIGLSLGTGLIYRDVLFPLFDQAEELFDTVAGLAYVATHECDIDQGNTRHFNDHVIICPIILLNEFAVDFSETEPESALLEIIGDIASDRIYRVFYLPPISEEVLPHGGLLYLNHLCSTHVNVFHELGAAPVCALSTYAQHRLDLKLTNHLFREKAELLPRLT